MNRRAAIVTAAAGLIAGPTFLAQTQQPAPDTAKRPSALDAEIVKDFVIAGHGDLDKTRRMLDQEPGLLNAEWDWGGGDWEMAIGGAGHMGRRDIAEFLISRGARMDIFVAAMLGKFDILEAVLTAYPGLSQSKGPHGITLAMHAEKGGEQAKRVLDFLKSFKA